MIGAGPHKGLHTAVAAGADERPLGEVRVRASAGQAKRLLQWAAAWPERAWAVEGAGGLGHLKRIRSGRVLEARPRSDGTRRSGWSGFPFLPAGSCGLDAARSGGR